MDKVTYEVRRANWLNIVRQCQERPANVTAKQWMSENGINEKSYYYWLRKFRQEAGEKMHLPAASSQEITFAEISYPAEHTADAAGDVLDISASNPAAVIRRGSLE